MKIFKTILPLFFSLLISTCIHGQNKVDYPYEVFSEIRISDQLSVIELSNTNLSSEHITIYMGTPDNEECLDLIAYSKCTLLYDGLTLKYTDRYGSFDFDSASLTNSTPFISYEGLNIKVGDNINLLNTSFQKAYYQRGTNSDEEYSVRIGLIDTSLVIDFIYNVSSDLITEISISQSNI